MPAVSCTRGRSTHSRCASRCRSAPELYGHAGLAADIEVARDRGGVAADRGAWLGSRSTSGTPALSAHCLTWLDCRRTPRTTILAALSAKDTPALHRMRAPDCVSRQRRDGLIALARLRRRPSTIAARAQALPSVTPIAAALDGLEMLAARCGGGRSQRSTSRTCTAIATRPVSPSPSTSPAWPSAVAARRPLRRHRQSIRPRRARPTGFSIDLRELVEFAAEQTAPGAILRTGGEATELRAMRSRALRARARWSCSGCRAKSRPRSRAIDFDRELRSSRRAAVAVATRHVELKNGATHGTERRRRRHPVGRRGQGQDRRLADRAAPTASCGSRAATTPATRSSSAARRRCCG